MANVVGGFTIDYETPSGDTENSTLAMLPLHWERATWTLRRRAPHAVEIIVPPFSHHVPGDFVPHRELRLKRDGVYVAWGAGFMGAAQVAVAGDEWGPITLPGYGNAAALAMFSRGTFINGYLGTDFSTGYDTDSVIGYVLDEANHGTGGDWFPAAGRTLGAAALSLDGYSPRGRSAMDVINEITAAEGWAWRASIDASGAFTFASSATVDTDRSATLHLIDRANCRITGVAQDDSRMMTSTTVYARTPAIRTLLNGAVSAGATSITVDSTTGMVAGDTIKLGAGATSEERAINAVTSSTVLDLNTGHGGVTNAYADNTEINTVTKNYRRDTRSAGASLAQTYHKHYEVLINDQLITASQRQEYGDALIDAYDAVQRTATVETMDPAMIAAILDAGLEPGDSVKLTSTHRYLSAWYTGATVRVQEMMLDLEPGGCRRIALSVGDPRLDDLGVVERMIAGLKISQGADTVA